MNTGEPITDLEVFLAMENFGGAFVVALSKAGRLADEDNVRRIKEAWPEYWFRYSALAKNLRPFGPKEER